MNWIIFAFGAALFAAAAAIVQKKTLIKEHAMTFSTVLALFNMIIALPFFFIIDYDRIEVTPLLYTYGVSILAAIAYFLVAKSVRHMEISDASPLLAFGPAFTALLAFLTLGEALTFFQIIGLSLLLIGAYLLELKTGHDHWEPLRIFRKSRYIHYIFLALILYAVCSVFDRVILHSYGMQPEAYIAFVHVFLAANFTLILSFFHNGVFDIIKGVKQAGWWILVVAIFTISYRFLQAQAVKIAYVALVSSVKRMSVLFSTIIGGELFKEKNLLRKSIAALIMVAGSIMIIL